ncbi:hypothetical protein ABZ092_12960 [Streptomyces bobili]|uniref:hypothetical protein n=1 Tax=Streptomyces bobili TaxID=67280 RepID=UPI0033A8B5C6
MAEVKGFLDRVNEYTKEETSRWRIWREAAILEGAWSNLRAADVALLELASEDYRQDRKNEILAKATRHLEADDPRLEEIRNAIKEKGATNGRTLASVLDAAYEAEYAELANIRSWRRSLWWTTLFMFIGIVAFVFWMWFHPSSLTLCFRPTDDFVACPSREYTLKYPLQYPTGLTSGWESAQDTVAVVIAGLAGASLTVVGSLLKIPGSNASHDLSIAVYALKFPTGAVTAILGILLIHGGFVPGLTSLDNRAQILAWAAAFGCAQQLVTHLIDSRAQRAAFQAGKAGVPADDSPLRSPGR